MARGRLRLRMALLRQREGSVVAEFALVAPLFFTLVMGGIEYGSIVYSMSSMQLAANIAARDIAVNNLSTAQAQARMAPFLPGWMANDVAMVSTESHPDQPRINTRTIRLTANAADAAVISIFTKAATWTVAAEANVQQEMPFNNSPGGDDDDDDGDDDD